MARKKLTSTPPPIASRLAQLDHAIVQLVTALDGVRDDLAGLQPSEVAPDTLPVQDLEWLHLGREVRQCSPSLYRAISRMIDEILHLAGIDVEWEKVPDARYKRTRKPPSAPSVSTEETL